MNVPLPFVRTVAAAILLGVLVSPGLAADPAAPAEFPYAIAVQTGETHFAQGDGLAITAVHGNRPHLEVGGRYRLDGTYTLGSADHADLVWFATARSDTGLSSIEPTSTMEVKQGAASFTLTRTFTNDGYPHLSFYVDGSPRSWVYFAEKGRPENLMTAESPAEPTAGASPAVVLSVPNAAIMAYLGEAIPPPDGLDPKYGPGAVTEAFKKASWSVGLQFSRLQVDDSEFPYLVYGLIYGSHPYQQLSEAVKNAPGYMYGGSVSGTLGPNYTYFAINITPIGETLPKNAEFAYRRVLIRLSMLGIRAAGEVPRPSKYPMSGMGANAGSTGPGWSPPPPPPPSPAPRQ
jgi:hypothetical protein